MRNIIIKCLRRAVGCWRMNRIFPRDPPSRRTTEALPLPPRRAFESVSSHHRRSVSPPRTLLSHAGPFASSPDSTQHIGELQSEVHHLRAELDTSEMELQKAPL